MQRVWTGAARRFSRVLARALQQGRPAGTGQGERLVFVGGAPRSGTTLVQHILDSHPQCFGGPEFDCIPGIMLARRELIAALEAGRIQAYTTRAQVDTAFAALVESFLLPAATTAGKHLLSEKSPFNAGVFSDLLELFPQCRAIHVVRDPRAVVASLLRVGERYRAKNVSSPPSTSDYQASIECVRNLANAGFEAGHRFQARQMTIVYERLVADPEPVIRGVCGFLGLPFHEAMLAPHAKKHPAQDRLVALDNGTWLDPSLGYRAIETSRIEAWREGLTSAQIADINAAFRDHPVYHMLGYRFEGAEK